MFDRDDVSRMDLVALAGISFAVSIPMIILMRSMSDSLEAIAQKLSQ